MWVYPNKGLRLHIASEDLYLGKINLEVKPVLENKAVIVVSKGQKELRDKTRDGS